MKNIKIGVIGAGMAWEKLHYPAFERLKDKYTIAAVCDRQMEKARAAASAVGLGQDKAFDSYMKMINTVEMDAVDILVPIEQTHEVAKDVIDLGKHIILEKPFAATINGAKELLKLGKKIKILLAENFRYEESHKIIKDLIDKKAIGNVVYFIDNHVKEFQEEMLGPSFASTEWRQHPDFKGGVFLDDAVHHMARHRFFFGNLEDVYARGRHTDADFCPYSCITALLSFDNQIAGHYTYYCIAKETQTPMVGLRIFGTDGEIFLESKECGFVNYTTKEGECQAIPYKPGEGYYNELINFYEAVVTDTPILSTPEKGLGDMQAVFDILKSIETGSAIASAGQPIKKLKAAFK
ncbi:MAG: Gfo/Idh/MocA family oxidoreductase [Clostridiales bacterium]|jgi:predicted dehydrogenase|nr:Gfo/Idh/MocA family oxidoreductase [Clostridiales bacterium]